ncbi:MAG: lysozyme [Pseudomonadales bacterium]
MRRRVNRAGLELIQHFESLHLEAYQDSVGVWTIGWGHTGLAQRKGRERVYEGLLISVEQAEKLLKKDLGVFEQAVQKLVKVKLNSNQFSALVSFAFNLGEANLRTSTLLKLLNERNYFGAAGEFKKWNRAGGRRMAGLLRRRLSERNLFCSFDEPILKRLPNNWASHYREL